MILSYETEVSSKVGVKAATVLHFMMNRQINMPLNDFLYEYLPYDGQQIEELLAILIKHGYVDRKEPEGGTGVYGYTVLYEVAKRNQEE